MPLPNNSDHLHPRRVAAYAKIREVLRRWDPIGAICESNQDEYDSYAMDFASRLDRRGSVDEILALMRRLGVECMGLRAIDEARARACATELVEYWRSWKDG